MTPSLRLIVAACVALPAAVSAHGSISKPTVTFKDIYNKNAPSATMSGTPGQYTGSAVIRDLADQAGSTCGNTDGSAAAQAAPSDGKVTFDISAVHVGPCEIWLDDSKVASANDCWATYSDKTIPVDYSKCTSSQCQLRWVWLATHNDPWEIYDNCVNIEGSGSGSGNSTATTTAPATTTAAPATTTTAPATTTAAPATTTTAPATTTAAPATTTTAPATTTAAPATTTKTPATTTSSPAASAGSSDDTPGTVIPAGSDSTSTSGCTYRGANNQTNLDAWCEANCAMNYCPEGYCVADC